MHAWLYGPIDQKYGDKNRLDVRADMILSQCLEV